MYAKYGNLEFARQLFDRRHQRDAVSWGNTIAAYAQSEDVKEALRPEGVSHDIVIMVSVLPVCAHLRVLRCREWIHAHMMKIELGQNIIPNPIYEF